MTKQQQINQIKEVILKNPEGFTCDFSGRLISKNEGYFIGITNIKGKRLNHLINKVLYIKSMGFNHLKNIYIGGWKDKDNNFYLDLSIYSKDLNISKILALNFNQLAIFDIKNLDSIYL